MDIKAFGPEASGSTASAGTLDDRVFTLDAFSLYKHCFVLIQHELGEARQVYLDIIVDVLYISYTVSPAETGEKTATTEIALLTG